MQNVLHIWNFMVKGFSKMYNFSFFGQFFFCKHFYYITGFCDKKLNFCKFANFFADSKSRAQELSYDVSFVIFGHKTWDLERGSNWPPPSISWFSSTPAGIGLKLALGNYLMLAYYEKSCYLINSTFLSLQFEILKYMHTYCVCCI